MAKLFTGKNSIDPSGTNIPTAEQNEAQFLSMQKQSQRLIDLQTEDMLTKKRIQQSGNIDSAISTSPKTAVLTDEYGQIGRSDLNQDMSQQPQAENADDIDRSFISQFQESFMKGFGESVIGSTGDVINLLGSTIPTFTMAEGNVLGRALREYGDDIGNEHTTYLRKKLEGQELTWGSLIDPDFWTTNVAEMLPMAIEFMVTGYGAGSAAKKGMGLFVKGLSSEARLAKATLALTDTAKAVGTGVKVAEDVLGSGKGLAKYLTRNVDGVLEMSKFSNEFVNASAAGLANNLLAGASNAMDYHKQLQAINAEEIANGRKAKYSEKQMADIASNSMLQNLKYAPIDALSWAVSYAKVGEKIGAGLSKKIGMKASEQVAKEAAIDFTKTNYSILKGLTRATIHAGIEGTEEQFQETYENWAQLKAKEKITGEVAPDYWDYFFSKENEGTRIASAALGGFMGGAMNLKFNESANKGIDYMNRMETLKGSIDASDQGGQSARTWHIRNTMVDLLHSKEQRLEAFDGFMSDQISRGNISPEEAIEYKEEFDEVSKDYKAASRLNVAGKLALAENTIKAKTLERIIANQSALYNENLKVIREEFGEEDMSDDVEEAEYLGLLKQNAINSPEAKLEYDALKQKIDSRKDSPIQKKYAKLRAEHEQQIKMMSLNLALAQQNRLNLISGKKASPLNIKFWVNKNGVEQAYILDDKKEKAYDHDAPMAYIEDSKAPSQGWEEQSGQQVALDEYGVPVNQGQEQSGVLLDPATMSERQVGLAQNQGGIVSGLSDKQFDRFVEMTDEQVYESAKTNLENMLKKVPKEAKDIYNQMIAKGKEGVAKMKAKLNPDGTPVVDENGEPVMVADDSAVEAKVDENLSKVPTSTEDNSNENEFEKNYEEKGLETQAQAEARKIAEAEEEFKKTIFLENKNEEEEQGEAPNYQVVKDKTTGRYSLIDSNTGESHPNGKTYSNSASAKKDLGNASLVGDIAGLAWKGTKGAVKLTGKGIVSGAKLAGKASQSVKGTTKILGQKVEKLTGKALEEFNRIQKQKFNQKLIAANINKDAQRRAIIEQSYYSHASRNNANNPISPVSKQQLDAYLDSTIAKFHYGPRVIDEQRTVNRMLKAKGIDINVVVADNLFSLVGAPAIGYALASTIYIDENSWDQTDIFMHEMAHINYKITRDTPVTKEIVRLAREDASLVEKVESLYQDKIVYSFDNGRKEITSEQLEGHYRETPESSEAFDQILSKQTIQEFFTSEGFTKKPDSEQHVINEELFTHYVQGPLAKNFNHSFEPIKERRRQKETKNWWKVMKGEKITFEPFAIDVVQKLNDGKHVPSSELMEHVFQNFADEIAKKDPKAFTSDGFASLVDMRNAKRTEEHVRVTDEKIKQRKNYDPKATKETNRRVTYERLVKKINQDVNQKMKDFSEQERKNQIDFQLEELENAMMEEGAFDDYESAKQVTFRGATRILNSFTRSLNYVKRKKFLENNGLASDFDEDALIDRDALISEFYNLAFETKGNTNDFIKAIENSRIEEIWQFNQYMEKIHPNEKMMYLSSMAYVMGNQQTISAIKNVVNADGQWETSNALSETENNTVQNHLSYLKQSENDAFNKRFTESGAQKFQYFLDAYNNIKSKNQTNDDYLAVLRVLAPRNVKFSALVNNQTINMRGHNVNVKTLIDKMVLSKVMEQNIGESGINVMAAKPFIEAIVDSNRKYTSYSVVQNAEGNMEPSKITNNHLLSELNGMNDFLTKDSKGNFPSFKSFKEKYAHLSDSANRTHENPVLRSIYDNAKNGVLRPSVSQYLGLTHLQRGENSLYKNSTDFAQTIEDFMMFSKIPNTNNYMQTLSAFADSPRKFLMSVKRIKFDEAFKPIEGTSNKVELTLKGRRMLESSWRIYDKSNQNLTAKQKLDTITSQEDYIEAFKKSVHSEIARWNLGAKDLIANKSVNPDYFENGKLSKKGRNKITEFVFNQSVNGMAMAEIFNPGIPFNDIVKRNKGNTAPVMSFGNPNLKMEPITIDDRDILDSKGNVIKKVEVRNDGAMYMTRSQAQKIVDAGLGVFDLNNGLKLMNYHVERDNSNFKGVSAYFKGYTTIIDEDTLVTEPGLRGIYDLLNERERVYKAHHLDKYGYEASEDLTNGEPNYINYAVPYSAIKSDYLNVENQSALAGVTFDNLNNDYDNRVAGNSSIDLESETDKIHNALDSLYYGTDKDGKTNFMGLSTNNFGPQQIMDKVTEEAITPVQFISSVLVNGMIGDNLAIGEEIQGHIRKDMANNLDAIIDELGDMNPEDYKTFILKNLDLENMDQGQRLLIEESLTNLNHPAVADFITNTLANRLKQAGNKLKTAGSVAQQKASEHYRIRNGYTVNGNAGLQGHGKRYNPDGSVGSAIMGIVLPKHMKDKVVFRQYLTEDDQQVKRVLELHKDLKGKLQLAEKITDQTAKAKAKSDVMKEIAIMIARQRHPKAKSENSYGYDVNDYIGSFEKDGVTVGWFVRGESVMGTRIPSHGPSSTGVFEAVDYLEGEGNQTIVHEDFSETSGSDYDGDSLFIQRKDKSTPNFNKALDRTVDLWTSPGMYEQTKAKIEFKEQAGKIVGNNTREMTFPMSPEYHRSSYNNTMISKRNIGIIFNTHRIANYLAAYNVELTSPINIDGNRIDKFSDKEVGQESRNNQSAMLANIILDNAKWGFADSLGLNDQTINQYSLLINLGFSLQQVNDIMNSKAVKTWNKHQSNNNNPFATKMKNADIKKAIHQELKLEDGIIKNVSINTNENVINTPGQMKNIIQLMENLEAINADILKVSKIMAGHKGIENNPFILEQQLKEFNAVVDSDKEKVLLKFPEAFKNNPDIKAYHDNASKILEIMKKANPIYSKSTSELMESLNSKIGFDEVMNKNQMKRASDIIKNFHTSRILGLNNTTSAQKTAIKQKVFRDINKYISGLEGDLLPGNRKKTNLDKSILFNRALNINIKEVSGQNHLPPNSPKRLIDEKSYVSANPRFFNESVTEEDRTAVQNEWKALPEEIKDGLITLDLMKNGLTGKLSLSILFDEGTNQDISVSAAEQSKNKNNPISKKVMDKLENLIISNEFNQNSSILNAKGENTTFKQGENLMKYISDNNSSLEKALKIGKGMIFKVDGKPYIFEGITDKEMKEISKDKDAFIESVILSKIKPFKKFEGDINLESISLADDTGRPLYRSRPSEQNNKNSFMKEATESFTSKKKAKPDLGNASRIDYHNYNDVTPLNQREFNVAMEYDNTISDEQKALVYKKYLQEKKEANDLTSRYNQTTFSKMNDEDLKKVYSEMSEKDLYAYSIITTPLVMELANRMGVEQSELTGMIENGKDISLMDSYLNNNNISSNHPVTQKLIKTLNEEYKKFVLERGKYIKVINHVTDALYKEKFGLSNNRIINTIQRVGKSLFSNRADIYQKLYGNLLSEETYTDANGVVKKEMKFKDDAEVAQLYSDKKISKAEYDFFTTFRKITGNLKNYDGNDKVRKGYVPHTSMDNFEMFANRGLLGLLVNSKGVDSSVDDVKVYTNISGQNKLMSFGDIKNEYNALSISGKQTTKDLLAFNKLKRTAVKLQKTGKNEDGSRLIYSNMQNETLLGMSPLTRFESSRSNKAELMPSMDLNKALVEYVHASLFTNGNGEFKGFKAMMPMIDGVMAYNDKNGYKNAYNYVKEVIKEGFIMKKEQELFGKKTDAVINGLVKGNTFYALGYKGLLIGKGLYAIGNLAVGKYMNLKREGGKSWITGEARYWGIDKGISLDVLDRRNRARNILSNLGYMEADFYDDVNIEQKSGLDSIFTKIALSPMAVTEDWIQRAHMLGMLTPEEFDLFDDKGNYKVGAVQITPERFHALEERVKNAHGKGFSPTDQSRIHRYALGKMFMQFSRHIPTQIRERFAKEDIDMNGQKYIGSLRQIGRSASDFFHNGMSPAKAKEYYASLEAHEKEAFLSGLRGMALMTMLGFIAGNSSEESQMLGSRTDAAGISSGLMSDANIHFDPDRMLLKAIPPAVRSTLSVLKGFNPMNSSAEE